MYRPKPSDFHQHNCYHDNFVRDFFAISLVTFAYSNFKKVTKIKELDNLKKHVNSRDSGKSKISQDLSLLSNSIFSSLIDSILICISFENYFKAKLLLNDFVIHEIDKEENKELFKKQKKQPISMTEICCNQNKKYNELKDTTLQFGFLLNNKNYIKYYNLDSKTIAYLKELNKKRNNLHFYMNETFKISKKEISEIENLENIINLDFAILNNTLLEKLGGVSKSRLPVKILSST